MVVEKGLDVHLVQPLDGLRRSGSGAAVVEGEDVEGHAVNLELGVYKRHDPWVTSVRALAFLG